MQGRVGEDVEIASTNHRFMRYADAKNALREERRTVNAGPRSTRYSVGPTAWIEGRAIARAACVSDSGHGHRAGEFRGRVDGAVHYR